MKLIKDIYNFLLGEQKVPATLNRKTGRPGSLANAIKKRHPVTFFYNGPRGEVQPGKRIKAEMVAMGSSKTGKMIVRAWVAPPSRSKTGFEKGNWRTFIVSRMNQIEIFEDETFDVKRPGYKEGNDNSMLVTYVTSDWSSTPEPQKPEEPKSEPTQQSEPQEPRVQDTDPQRVDTTEPEQSVEPQSNELPQPEPENTPSMEPPKGDDQDNDQDGEDNNYDGLNENIKRIKELLYN